MFCFDCSLQYYNHKNLDVTHLQYNAQKSSTYAVLISHIYSTKHKCLSNTCSFYISSMLFFAVHYEIDTFQSAFWGERGVQVDLEHHHYRSFQGFVCLMQISTRSEDFIVDTLALRGNVGPCLKEIFADPSIRKVYIIIIAVGIKGPSVVCCLLAF